MKLLMLSGDRTIIAGKQGAFYHMLEEFSRYWDRIDILCPRVEGYVPTALRTTMKEKPLFGNVFFHASDKNIFSQAGFIAEKGTELLLTYHHDVMTVHEYPPFYNGIGAKRLAKKANIPYVLEIHHIVGYPYPASFAEYLGKILSRLYLRADARTSTQVRVVNHMVERKLISWGIPSEKISVVPSFYLDKDVCQPDEKIEKRYDIAFCARLVKNKGLMELIDALYGLSRVSLLIIGDGPLKKTAERRVASLGLLDRVTFTGWLPTQADVMQAIQSARVFVMNSTSEGGPRVSLEAMACGMPVLSTKVGVMPDVIRDGYNGMFTMGDRTDLMIKIDHLLHDPQLRQSLGLNARSIIQTFEKRTLLSGYARFLQSLVTHPSLDAPMRVATPSVQSTLPPDAPAASAPPLSETASSPVVHTVPPVGTSVTSSTSSLSAPPPETPFTSPSPDHSVSDSANP